MPSLHVDWVHRYARLGWRAYPVEPGTKKAIFTGWQRSATTDPGVIARQWQREPYPNVGLICGESFAVFDIEAPHLPAFYHHLDAHGYVVPETMVCRSGRGGLHLYVAPLAAILTTRKLRLDGRHIGEYKTTGGVLAPPSVTVGPYAWLWLPDEGKPTIAPDWLAALIDGEPHSAGERPYRGASDPAIALDILACRVRDEGEGNRNDLLYWAARRAAAEGIEPQVARSVFLRAAKLAGLRDDEADATITSAFRAPVAR